MMPLQGSYLHLRMGKTHFALPTGRVSEILTEFLCAEKPGGKPWLYGVLYDHRQVMAVITMEPAAELPPAAVLCRADRGMLAFFAAEVKDTFSVTEQTQLFSDDAFPVPGWNYLVQGETKIYLPGNEVWGKPSDSING